jgi:hypothetical protein
MKRYEIRVVGHLDPRRVRSLGAEGCRWLPAGESVLTFEAQDQAALYGLIARLRDSGLELAALIHIHPKASPTNRRRRRAKGA